MSIVNDNELENEEEFSLTLTTGEDRVNLDPNSTTIRITDDDGEEIVINIYWKLMVCLNLHNSFISCNNWI